MARQGRWTLKDLLDFEWLLRSDDGQQSAAADRAVYRKAVKPALDGVRDRVEQRRIGLMEWFKVRRESVDEDFPGGKIMSALGFGSTVLGFMMVLSGSGVVLGLLQLPEQRFNLGHFLLATLGIQWVLLVLGLLLFFVRRQATDALGVVGRMMLWIVKKTARDGGKAWLNVAKDGERYRAVCVWTLARIGQVAGVCFNVGLIIGLVGVLTFQDVRFFWETTSESEPETVVQSVVNVVASPWKWAVPDSVPDLDEIQASRLVPGGSLEKAGWPNFLIVALVIWGLLPRLLLWGISVWGRERALKRLDFQAPRHRELWRRMSHVERMVETAGQEDEAVVIEVGGLGLELADVMGFLRMRLRVHPVALHQLGVIDEAKEAAAMQALEKARGGVVLLVEGWSLSPRQITAVHSDIRAKCGTDLQIWFVVMGAGNEEALDEEMEHWKDFVDGLEDVAADVVRYSTVELEA